MNCRRLCGTNSCVLCAEREARLRAWGEFLTAEKNLLCCGALYVRFIWNANVLPNLYFRFYQGVKRERNGGSPSCFSYSIRFLFFCILLVFTLFIFNLFLLLYQTNPLIYISQIFNPYHTLATVFYSKHFNVRFSAYNYIYNI